MPFLHRILLVALLLQFFAFAGFGLGTVFGQTKDSGNAVVINEKVSRLFQQMREGEYHRAMFPELTWDDVPSLMEIAESELLIENVPTNPLSSQMQPATREGIIALWLVEGIRHEGKFPSLNCMLVDRESGLSRNHPSLHATTLERYRKWWHQIEPAPVEENAELAPLMDGKLGWY